MRSPQGRGCGGRRKQEWIASLPDLTIAEDRPAVNTHVGVEAGLVVSEGGVLSPLEVQECCDRKYVEPVCSCEYCRVSAYGREFDSRGHGLAASGCKQHGPTEKHRKAYQIEQGLRDAGVSKVVLVTWTMPTKRAFETWGGFGRREGFDLVGLGSFVDYLEGLARGDYQDCNARGRARRCFTAEGRHLRYCRGRKLVGELGYLPEPQQRYCRFLMSDDAELMVAGFYQARALDRARARFKVVRGESWGGNVRGLEPTGQGVPHFHRMVECDERLTRAEWDHVLIDSWVATVPGTRAEAQRLTLPGETIRRMGGVDGEDFGKLLNEGVAVATRYITGLVGKASGELTAKKHDDPVGWRHAKRVRRWSYGGGVRLPSWMPSRALLASHALAGVFGHDEWECRRVRGAGTPESRRMAWEHELVDRDSLWEGDELTIERRRIRRGQGLEVRYTARLDGRPWGEWTAASVGVLPSAMVDALFLWWAQGGQAGSVSGREVGQSRREVGQSRKWRSSMGRGLYALSTGLVATAESGRKAGNGGFG